MAAGSPKSREGGPKGVESVVKAAGVVEELTVKYRGTLDALLKSDDAHLIDQIEHEGKIIHVYTLDELDEHGRVKDEFAGDELKTHIPEKVRAVNIDDSYFLLRDCVIFDLARFANFADSNVVRCTYMDTKSEFNLSPDTPLLLHCNQKHSPKTYLTLAAQALGVVTRNKKNLSIREMQRTLKLLKHIAGLPMLEETPKRVRKPNLKIVSNGENGGSGEAKSEMLQAQHSQTEVPKDHEVEKGKAARASSDVPDVLDWEELLEGGLQELNKFSPDEVEEYLEELKGLRDSVEDSKRDQLEELIERVETYLEKIQLADVIANKGFGSADTALTHPPTPTQKESHEMKAADTTPEHPKQAQSTHVQSAPAKAATQKEKEKPTMPKPMSYPKPPAPLSKEELDARVKLHEKTHGSATLYGFATRHFRGAAQQVVAASPAGSPAGQGHSEAPAGDSDGSPSTAGHAEHRGESAVKKEGEVKDKTSPKQPEAKKPGESQAEGKGDKGKSKEGQKKMEKQEEKDKGGGTKGHKDVVPVGSH